MRTTTLCASLYLILALFCAQAFAQETTLKVGVVGTRPAAPPDAQSLSTADVDPVLFLVAPSRYGAHYTRDKANALVGKLETLRTQLEAQLRTIVSDALDGKGFEVTSTSVNTNPVSVSFAQTQSGVRVTLTGLSASAAVRFKYPLPALCFSPHGHAALALTVGGDYDLPTGALINPRIDYWVYDMDMSCGGLLGTLQNAVLSTFGVQGIVRDKVLNAVSSAASTALQTANMRTIFSVSDFLDGLRDFSHNAILNQLANEAIDSAQDIVANPSQLYRGVKLTISVSYGAAGNTVSFIASNAEETAVYELQYSPNLGMTIFFDIPPGTSQATLYWRSQNSSTWNEWMTFPNGVGSYFVLGGMTVGTEIVAIGQNAWHSHLRSEGGLSAIVDQNPICTHFPCEPIDP